MTAADALLDGSTTDSDTINIRSSATAPIYGTLQNIENINYIASSSVGLTGDSAQNLSTVTGAKKLTVSGTFAAASAGVVFNNAGATGITTYNFSGITTSGADGAVVLNMGTTTPTANLTITGGAGNDTLNGGTGDDVMTGGAGNDTLNGGAGNNTLDVGSGSGAQVMTFSNGNNTVSATGATGAVTVTGGNGNNTVSIDSTGGATITLGSGANTISTGSGIDAVTVGNGVNTISTGAGADTITAGTGANTITAGTGADVITIAANGTSKIVEGASDTGVVSGALNTGDLIKGFATNGDQLSLGFADGTVSNTITLTDDVAGDNTVAKLAVAAQGNASFVAGTTQYALVTLGAANGFVVAPMPMADGDKIASGDSLLFIDKDLNGTFDTFLVLKSITSTTFAATDIIR